MRKWIFSVLLLPVMLCAQSPWYEPGSWGDILLQMNESRSFYSQKDRGPRWINHSNRYYLRGELDSTFRRIMESDTFVKIALYIPSAAEFNSRWLQVDNAEFLSDIFQRKSQKPLLKGLYKYPALFYNFREGSSSISLNPLFNFQAGPPGQWKQTFIQNTRGLELRGTFGAKVGFYTRVTENQWYPQPYVQTLGDSLGIAPGVGWWRPFYGSGFDFFSVKGYLNVAIVKHHINAAFGHDKLFIGNGFRSMILSDFAKEYLFLRLNTHIGPFHYQNIFAQLNNRIPSPGMLPGNTLLPKKYMTVHRASVLIKKRIEIGATEMVVFDRDSLGDGGFEAEYLNPVIFYRSIESNLGSRDNAMMALDAKAYLFKNWIAYGQFVVDEFRIKEIRAGNGWWANKFAWQYGLKTTLNVKNGLLFLQAEQNSVKPYTYSHYRSSQSWTNYGQSLAHPLGANFRETLLRAIYQPGKWAKFRLSAIAMFAQKGYDSSYYSGKNFGGDLHKSNDTRVAEYGNKMLQGNQAALQNIRVDLSYMLRHNLYIDLGYQIRNQTGWNAGSGQWLNFGLRLNLEQFNTMY